MHIEQETLTDHRSVCFRTNRPALFIPRNNLAWKKVELHDRRNASFPAKMICVHLNLEAAICLLPLRCLHSLNIICEWKFINPNRHHRHWIYALPLFAEKTTRGYALFHMKRRRCTLIMGRLENKCKITSQIASSPRRGANLLRNCTPFWTHTTAAATTICCAWRGLDSWLSSKLVSSCYFFEKDQFIKILKFYRLV